jgi:hypothetical protein
MTATPKNTTAQQNKKSIKQQGYNCAKHNTPSATPQEEQTCMDLGQHTQT